LVSGLTAVERDTTRK